jgi:hypothetical protein
MSISVGDRVRSFDFSDGGLGRDLSGERACYVEGRVQDLVDHSGCIRYHILVDRDVFGGEESDRRVGRFINPPVNGVPRAFGSGVTDFVELAQ